MQVNKLNRNETETDLEVNQIKQNFRKQDGEQKSKHSVEKFKTIACYRCSSPDHLRNDAGCPAINKECQRCGLLGHFDKCCRTKIVQNGKQKGVTKHKNQKKYAIAPSKVGDSSSSDDIFNISTKSDAVILLDVKWEI